ncbi:MAG: PilZ domain-containing protein [Firmicutes bacterium]|nr:PilZ domain-containing protein [Bacillota bacterium]
MMISLFGRRKRKQEEQQKRMVDPTAALAEIGVIGLNGTGTIVFCNNRMLQILEQAMGRQITQNRVINQPLADVMEQPLSKTLIGHSLVWKEEVNGHRVKIGNDTLIVSTLLLWGAGRQTLLGCIGYYIPYTPEPAREAGGTARYVVERLARERGYPATRWISDISLEHALQLQQCLTRNTHTIPNPRHCAFARKCAFNPVYGCFSLERRRFYRVPIRIPLRIFVEAGANGQIVDEPLASKFCEGQTVDLSLGGICLQSAIKFPIGIMLRIEFLLPTPFQSLGQVMWNRRAESGQWEHGIKFVTLGKEERAVILRLLSSRVPCG